MPCANKLNQLTFTEDLLLLCLFNTKCWQAEYKKILK